MGLDLDKIIYDELPAQSSNQSEPDSFEVEVAKDLLLAALVLKRMEVTGSSTLLGRARGALTVAYVKQKEEAEGHKAVKSANILLERFEKQVTAALDRAMGNHRAL